MLTALGMEHWKAKELACSRKGYWKMEEKGPKPNLLKKGYFKLLRNYHEGLCSIFSTVSQAHRKSKGLALIARP